MTTKDGLDFKANKLEYNRETCRLLYDGKEIGQWDDEANLHYPEDLTWDRDIGLLVVQIFKAGISQGKTQLLTSTNNCQISRCVLPERMQEDYTVMGQTDLLFAEGFNDCLDEMKKLNPHLLWEGK